MRRSHWAMAAVVLGLVGMPVWQAHAQQPKRPGADRPNRPGRFVSPLMRVLDANGDGELSSAEIAAASEALRKLDRNNDGKLSGEELGIQRRGGFGPSANPQEFVNRLLSQDKNGDKKISREEAGSGFLSRVFDRLDVNNDGFIDEAELKQFAERFGRGRPGGKKRPAGDRKRPGGARKRPADN